MPTMTRWQRLINLSQTILKTWVTPEEKQFPGVRFDSEIDLLNQLPEMMKKDNVGWEYVNAPPDGGDTSKRG